MADENETPAEPDAAPQDEAGTDRLNADQITKLHARMAESSRKAVAENKTARLQQAHHALDFVREVLGGNYDSDSGEFPAPPADKPTLADLVNAYRQVAAAARNGDTVGVVRGMVTTLALVIDVEKNGLVTDADQDAEAGVPVATADQLVDDVKACKEEYARHVARANQVGATSAADIRRLRGLGVPGLGVAPAGLSPGVVTAAIDLAVQLLVWLRRAK